MAAFVEKRQPAVKHSCAGSFPAREPGSGPPTTVDVDQAQGYKARLPRNAGHSRDNMAHHKSAKKRINRNANRFDRPEQRRVGKECVSQFSSRSYSYY